MMSFASEAMHPAIGESHVPQSDGDWAANHVRRRPEDGAPPKRLSIALVIDRIEPFYRGGYERRAWELARRLALRNQVTVFTSAPSSEGGLLPNTTSASPPDRRVVDHRRRVET
jgi:hypothetical protein